MAQINWSDISKADYWDNIDYLLKDWTEKEAIDFMAKVDAVLQIIAINPKIFQKSGHKHTLCAHYISKNTILSDSKKKHSGTCKVLEQLSGS
jgi:plasmid stabilization system protein ParE